MGLYGDNGTQNGSYYIILILLKNVCRRRCVIQHPGSLNPHSRLCCDLRHALASHMSPVDQSLLTTQQHLYKNIPLCAYAATQ